MKTYVYVDGFNLYYGSVKSTPYKWLNIRQLCQFLLPRNQIIQIKYFTARVSARPKDPDQPNRQELFFRALRTLPDLEVIYGSFLEHVIWMPIAHPAPGAPKYAQVIKTEEKGSDVNIAAHMVNDGLGKWAFIPSFFRAAQQALTNRHRSHCVPIAMKIGSACKGRIVLSMATQDGGRECGGGC